MKIKDLAILSDEDKGSISGLTKLFNNYMTAHSEFQIRNFILNDIDIPTPEGKYHQSVRELYSRYQNLINQSHQYLILKNEIGILKLEAEALGEQLYLNPRHVRLEEIKCELVQLDIDRKNIDITHKELRLKAIEKNASEVIREMNVFLDVIKVLDSKIGPETRDESGLPARELSEAKYWFNKQYISEAIHNDRARTPFNKLLGLPGGQKPQLAMDDLGRMVFLPPKPDQPRIEEDKDGE